MARRKTVQGIERVMAQLHRHRKTKLEGLARGLARAGLFLQRESQKIVPVDYGVLKASAFTRVDGAGTTDVTVTVGYTAAYAIHVHENPDAAHGAAFNAKYATELASFKKRKRKGKLKGNAGSQSPFRHSRGPNQAYKFLETPFRKKRAEMLEIIKAEVKR